MSQVQFSGSWCQGSGSQGGKSQVPESRVSMSHVPVLQGPRFRFSVFKVLGPGSRVLEFQCPESQVSGPDFRLWLDSHWFQNVLLELFSRQLCLFFFNKIMEFFKVIYWFFFLQIDVICVVKLNGGRFNLLKCTSIIFFKLMCYLTFSSHLGGLKRLNGLI